MFVWIGVINAKAKGTNNMKESLAILTMAIGDEYRETVSAGRKSLDEYCERHKYQLYSFAGLEVTKDERHVAWRKLEYMIRECEKRNYDWMMWLDADTMIYDQTQRLEKWFSNQPTEFIFSTDAYCVVNAGVWFCRTTPTALRQLRLWFNSPINHSRFWEQAAIESDLPWANLDICPQLAGLYNICNPAFDAAASKIELERGKVDEAFKLKAKRQMMFDPTYHGVCHFAGRNVEHRSLKKSMDHFYTLLKR